MSNLETFPEEIVCTEGDHAEAVEFLAPRMVPLGGPRAMPVRRTLPQKQRSLIGAWCFLDHYGPDLVPESGGMKVPRHPHTGLATVSWLFTGKVAHRDSAGYEAIVRPGEVNLMIAGRGISHQEFSTPDTGVLHGAQLWYALPEETRNMAPTFQHYAPEPVQGDGSELRVFLGSLAGSSSPVTTYTPPLLGAEAVLHAGGRLELDLDPSFEHGILLDTGEVSVDGTPMAVDHLHYLRPGRSRIVAGGRADAGPGADPRRRASWRTDSDVVELCRAHPRGSGRLPRGLAGRDRRRAGRRSRRRYLPGRCPVPPFRAVPGRVSGAASRPSFAQRPASSPRLTDHPTQEDSWNSKQP